MAKVIFGCDVCSKQKPGWCWLGGADYVECPNCEGKGKIEMNEYKVRKGERLVSQAGVGVHKQLTEKLWNWN